MNDKRLIGTGKIFLYSCGAAAGLAGIVWLLMNSIFAVYFAGKKAGSLGYYTGGTADVITPWLLMAVSMVTYYRYWKICSANNVSGIRQAMVFPFVSLVVSAAFAAADLIFTKLIMQMLYGGIVCTRFESDSSYFEGIIHKYMISIEGVPVIYSPYTVKNLLLIFAMMTMYYYSFFIAGSFVMQCLRYIRKVTVIYNVVTILLLISLVCVIIKTIENDNLFYSIERALMWAMAAVTFSNPFTFLFVAPYISRGSISDIRIYFIILAIFIFAVILFSAILSKFQFPGKRRIKIALENYYSENNIKKGGSDNE